MRRFLLTKQRHQNTPLWPSLTMWVKAQWRHVTYADYGDLHSSDAKCRRSFSASCLIKMTERSVIISYAFPQIPARTLRSIQP